MPSLPEDLYPDILLKLPVESLRACKCVCKNWYALISSSDFVKSHLNLTTQKNNPILMLDCARSIKNVKYSIDYDSSVCEIEELDYPFKSVDYDCRVLGSCNGLVCIQLLDDDKDSLFLWNPATGEYKELPKSPNEFQSDVLYIHGLGYDHKTDDYKFAISVTSRSGVSRGVLFQVYTLSSNAWTVKKSHYWIPMIQTAGVLVNGNLHWLAIGQTNYVLVSLDITEENFKEVQLPKELLEKSKDMCMLVLGVLEGCLCALVRSYVNDVKTGFELWAMLDYGVQESWTKRYVIARESMMIRDQVYFSLWWSSKNGDILLLSRSLHLYDPKHGSARELKINNIPFMGAYNYFESLVSLNSGTYVGAEYN